jgi:riboflavin biosynthesis pyrimidine reductase
MDAWRGFVARKQRVAGEARIERFRTTDDQSANFDLCAIEHPWTMDYFDGPFWYSGPTEAEWPSMNLVFVQSRDGNTGSDEPSMLGGGETDKHLIYEGLSRVLADAVMTGAHTARGLGPLSVWHPTFIEMRGALGKPRHPAQIIVTSTGAVQVDQLMFNVPELTVIVVTTDAGAERLTPAAASRPWLRVISTGVFLDLRAAASLLRRGFGQRLISVIGGRTLATALLDAGLIADLYLTTGARHGGEPNTPYYTGKGFERALCVRKVVGPPEAQVLFEHFLIGPNVARRRA